MIFKFKNFVSQHVIFWKHILFFTFSHKKHQNILDPINDPFPNNGASPDITLDSPPALAWPIEVLVLDEAHLDDSSVTVTCLIYYLVLICQKGRQI